MFSYRHPGLVPGSTPPLGMVPNFGTASLAQPWTPAGGRGDDREHAA
ncbi:hypothetical protein [Sphingomonas turrisvirgatae]|nr:hypothetical protein [Sphingomonas turrisvirgatae]